jgi:hypothetical protein
MAGIKYVGPQPSDPEDIATQGSTTVAITTATKDFKKTIIVDSNEDTSALPDGVVILRKGTALSNDQEVATYIAPGNATRTALDAVYAPTNGARPVGKGELQLNVYDFGAKDTTIAGQESFSSQEALDATMVAAAKLAASGDRVWVSIPHGAVRGTFNVKTAFICFTGPGTLLDGEILYKSDTTNALPRFYSIVYNIGLRPSNPGSARTGGIRVVGGAFIEIHSCKLQDMENGVLLDTWEGLAGQQNKTINVHDNQIVNTDRPFSGNNRDGTTWDAHADLTFARNITRNGYIRHVDLVGVDGIDISDNVMFNVGYQSTDTFHRQMKQETIFIGRNSQWISIRGNKIFESGASGINLDMVRSAVVEANQLIWTGQVSQTPAIRINTTSELGINNILVTNNLIDECTQHGIAVVGTGNASNIFIPDTNSIRLFRATTRNVYVGSATLVTNNIARIYVDSTVTVPPRINISQSEYASRSGVLSIGGMYSVARMQTHRENYETTISFTKAITAGTAVTTGVLRSTANTPDSNAFVGKVRVTIKNYFDGPTSAPRVGRHEFTVFAAGTTKTISNEVKAGLTGASTDGGNPSFVFTIQPSGTLIATPQGNTAGTFEITLTATESMQVSYTTAEFNALPLNNPL